MLKPPTEINKAVHIIRNPLRKSLNQITVFLLTLSTTVPAIGPRTILGIEDTAIRMASCSKPIVEITQIVMANEKKLSPNFETNWPNHRIRKLRFKKIELGLTSKVICICVIINPSTK